MAGTAHAKKVSMISVFKGTLLALARERSVFIWVLAFPLVLSTMFAFMFATSMRPSSNPSAWPSWPMRATRTRRGSPR